MVPWRKVFTVMSLLKGTIYLRGYNLTSSQTCLSYRPRVLKAANMVVRVGCMLACKLRRHTQAFLHLLDPACISLISLKSDSIKQRAILKPSIYHNWRETTSSTQKAWLCGCSTLKIVFRFDSSMEGAGRRADLPTLISGVLA